MPITTLSSREFNQDASKAKKAACTGPVFITDRGRPAQVLLSIQQYQKLTGSTASIIDMLAMPESEGIRFSPKRFTKLFKPADLS